MVKETSALVTGNMQTKVGKILFAAFKISRGLSLPLRDYQEQKMISLQSSMAELNAINKGTLMEQLGMEYLELKEGYVKARMPVDFRTRQPFQILHGGASIALAETIASLGSAALVGTEIYDVRGASVNANHIGTADNGYVIAEANLIHRGRITHVWDVEVRDQKGTRISVARITVIVVPKKEQTLNTKGEK